MIQCILKSKIKFIGLIGFTYTRITVADNNGVSIEDIPEKEAKSLILNKDVSLVPVENYEMGEYGKIYTDEKFKETLDSDPKLKKLIYKLLKKLDNE